jgi:hypothetical protein
MQLWCRLLSAVGPQAADEQKHLGSDQLTEGTPDYHSDNMVGPLQIPPGLLVITTDE